MKRRLPATLLVLQGSTWQSSQRLSKRAFWCVWQALKKEYKEKPLTAFDIIHLNPALVFLNVVEK